MEAALVYAWIPKALVYALAQLAVGIAVARPLTLPPAVAPSSWDRWLVQLARIIAGLLLVALALRLWIQTASAFGASDAFALDNLRVIALESRWGTGWRTQMMTGAALLSAAWLIPWWRPGWWVFAICAVAVTLALPLLGHAAGSQARHGIHAVHALGAGAWIGTLGVIALAAWRHPPGAADASVATSLVSRFSPIALTAAALVTLSGLIAASLYVGSWHSLTTTTYGRLLLLKLFAVGGVGACGWMNWRQARQERLPRRFLVTLEYLVALLAIALTGVLTETEHP